jgi:hypothetical protein
MIFLYSTHYASPADTVKIPGQVEVVDRDVTGFSMHYDLCVVPAFMESSV